MANAGTENSASDRLFELVGRLKLQDGFAEVVASLSAGHAATLDGVWGIGLRAGDRHFVSTRSGHAFGGLPAP